MSKVDALRAMREEKYARLQAGAKARPAPTVTAAATAAPAKAVPATKAATKSAKPAAEPAEPAAEGATCGHQSMNGRACTREAGHPQKSHRYS